MFRTCQQDRLYLKGEAISAADDGARRMLQILLMTPGMARALTVVIILATLAIATTVVNSEYHGDLIMGVLIIVLPFLALSIFLPYVLPVKCPRCRGKMRFHFRPAIKTENGEAPRFAYICEWCRYDYEWEGASSSSSLD